jgi:hypothetical protein
MFNLHATTSAFLGSKPYRGTTVVIPCYWATAAHLTCHGEARSKLFVMENKPDKNLFREVHRRVQEVRDKARKTRDDAARSSYRIADDEAKKEGFDRPAALPPSEDGSQ